MRLRHAPLNARPLVRFALAVALLVAAASPHAREAERPAQNLDAFVEVDRSSGEWTIGNSGIRYTLIINRDGTLTVGGLAVSGSSDLVTISDQPDALLTIGGDLVRLGAPHSDFLVDSVDASAGPHFVALAVRLVSPARGLSATRRYVVFPGASAVEMWTEIASTDGETHTVENLNSYALTLANGEVTYVKGLDAPESEGGSFSKRTRWLTDGERLDLGSPTLSSETDMPYFSVGDGRYRVFSGLVWSGAWSAALERRESTLNSHGRPSTDVGLGAPGSQRRGPARVHRRDVGPARRGCRRHHALRLRRPRGARVSRAHHVQHVVRARNRRHRDDSPERHPAVLEPGDRVAAARRRLVSARDVHESL